MPKHIKDVFADYTIDNNLIDAEIENINLYKKTNKLQVSVISNKKIGLGATDTQEIEVTEKSVIFKYTSRI